jgi:hypothetical protein
MSADMYLKIKMSQPIFPVEDTTKIFIEKFGKKLPIDEDV